MFQKVVLASLNSFFQLNHEIIISLYFIGPLHYVAPKGNNILDTILIYF